MTQKYHLILVGKKAEADKDKVVATLSKIFKIPAEKATVLLNKPTVIKKHIEKEVAEHYQKKLEAVGLKTVLKAVVEATPIQPAQDTSGLSLVAEETPQPQSSSGLSLVSEETPQPQNSPGLSLVAEETTEKAPKVPSPGPQETVQPVQTAQPADIADDNTHSSSTPPEMMDEDDETPMESETFLQRRLIDDITGLSVIVGVVTAILGALLWCLIAVNLHMELAWVAILIGATIGFAVATSGGYGRSTGILCAVLAAIAILLGKYWAVQGIMSNAMDEFREAFQPEFVSMQETAQRYSPSMSNDEFIAFFQEFNAEASVFSDAPEISSALGEYINELSPEDIAELRSGLEPELDKMAHLDFDSWFENVLLPEIEGMQDAMGLSAANLTKENFDIIDILFLVVGVFAAFKVGGREDY